MTPVYKRYVLVHVRRLLLETFNTWDDIGVTLGLQTPPVNPRWRVEGDMSCVVEWQSSVNVLD